MKISIITVCYNAEKTIADAMESVARQRELFDCSDCSIAGGLEIEHIVVDGGSTDGTLGKIKDYELRIANEGRRNFAFKWLSEKDRGMYDALNKGMRMATGDVIGILNADDVLAEEDTLARIVRLFDCSIDGCYADIRFVRELGGPTVRYCSGKWFRPWMFRFGVQTAHPSTFFRRECFEKWGDYSLDYGMYGDFELLCRFMWKNRAKMRYLPMCTTVMRYGGASTDGWRTNLKINRSDLRALRANGCWSCLPLLYLKYVFKVWGFVFRRRAVDRLPGLSVRQMSTMKIVHVCDGWQAQNGAANIARLIAGEQSDAGHDVVYRRFAGVSELRAADEVWIHCGWKPCLWWAALWAKKAFWMPEACYDPVRRAYHGWKKRLVGPIERWALRRCDRVVATCAAEAEWIRAYARGIGDQGSGIRVEVTDLKRFFHIVRLFDCSDCSIGKKGSLHLLYLGRRHPLKGLEYLERAVAELAEVGSRSRTVELRIVSDHFGEALERDWEWCDVLVLPTLSENFGLVVAEALERGKRVITTDGAPVWEGQPGVVYLKGYRNGTDEERVKLLKSALERFLVEYSV